MQGKFLNIYIWAFGCHSSETRGFWTGSNL